MTSVSDNQIDDGVILSSERNNTIEVNIHFIIKQIIYSYMSMICEIEKLMGEVGTSANFRVINLGGNSLYVEGIKSVVSFGENEMRFQLKKKLLIIAGENLKVKYLDKTTCVINGEIKVVQTL